MRQIDSVRSWILLAMLTFCLCAYPVRAEAGGAKAAPKDAATIDVDAAKMTGKISPYVFGQNIEYEHGTISGGEQNENDAHGLHTGGLWAEMLRDRKFEEGDLDADGVANAWVPEELITNHYWELNGGQGKYDRYWIDHQEFYGGGAAQAIEVYGDGSQHASIYQVGLHFTKGHTYQFYVYLKRRGNTSAWAEFEKLGGPQYARQDFRDVSDDWQKYTAEFTAPEDTDSGRIRIGVQGNGIIWTDSASLMPADNYHGMRRDVIDALKPLSVPLIRYPGGCFADTYHWKDGIGPRDRRPERWSPKWNEWEPNDVGTDEFMDFAQQLGSDVHMTTDYLSGTPEEAGAWVEYTNGSADTPLGRLRSENGHAAPYGIKIWAVGNESQELCSDEYIGANRIEDYVQRFQQYKSAIQKADPSTRVMAVGAPPGPLQWNKDMLGLMPVDLLATSIYTGEGERRDNFDTKIIDLDHFYRHVVAEPLDFDHQLGEIITHLGDRFPADRPVVAVTEYQAWWLTERVDEDFRLADALYLAGVFHALMRRSPQVFLGEVESIINVQGVVEVGQTSVKLTKVAANPFGSSENVNIREKAVRVERLPFTYRFPAHSVTILEMSSYR